MSNILYNNLPTDFIKKMKEMLSDEADAFFDSFNNEAQKAFHLNNKRAISEDILYKLDNINISKIPYYNNGYYYDNSFKVGSSVLFHLGSIYSQDPAAMMPVAALSPYIKGNEKILDMCSAPGGKMSQLAMLLNENEGFMIANEINPSRNKILCSNTERMGYSNVVVTKLDPVDIANQYSSYFDIIVVDAPCSGEGMFRKYPESINEWSKENVNICKERQKYILSNAVKALNNDGYLLYSTCTYSKEEDEEIISWLLQNYSLETVPLSEEIIKSTKACEIANARKFFPHIAPGEGQFLCLLKKNGIKNSTVTGTGNLIPINDNEYNIINNEIKSYISINKSNLYKYLDKIIYIPVNPNNFYLANKGITQAFVTIGSFISSTQNSKNKYEITKSKPKYNSKSNQAQTGKAKFEPSYSLFHSLGHLFTNTVNLNIDDPLVYKYLHGEEIEYECDIKGYALLTVNNIPLGPVKVSANRLKNHYPKGLRNNN